MTQQVGAKKAPTQAGSAVIGPDSDGDELVGRGRLARLLKVSPKSVGNFVGEGMPTEERNGRRLYPLGRCAAWYKTRQAHQGERRALGADYEAAHRAHTWSKARRASRSLERLRADFMLLEHGEEALGASLERVRVIHRQWAAGLAGRLPDAREQGEAMIALREETHALMATIYGGADIPEGETLSPSAEPADSSDLDYPASISAGNAARLNALSGIHDIQAAREDGQLMDMRTFGRRLDAVYSVSRQRILAAPHKFALQLASTRTAADREALVALILADLEDALTDSRVEELAA
jgi:hypothetical protein